MNYFKSGGQPRLAARGGSHCSGSESSLTPGDGQWLSGHSPPQGGDPLSWQTLPSLPWSSLTHVLASVLAGLLWGQLANQQGLQELAHEIEIPVESAEGILGNKGEVVAERPLPLSLYLRPGRAGLTSRTSMCLSLGHGTERPTSEPQMLSRASSPAAASAPGSQGSATWVTALDQQSSH